MRYRIFGSLTLAHEGKCNSIDGGGEDMQRISQIKVICTYRAHQVGFHT